MRDASVRELSYLSWRTETARISQIAQRIRRDDRFTRALQAVHDPFSNTSNGTPSASVSAGSFFSRLLATAPSEAEVQAQATATWFCSLAELLALTELPPTTSVDVVASLSSSFSAEDRGRRPSIAESHGAAHRGFLRVCTVVASNGSELPHSMPAATPTNNAMASSATPSPLRVSSSHAVMPISVAHGLNGNLDASITTVSSGGSSSVVDVRRQTRNVIGKKSISSAPPGTVHSPAQAAAAAIQEEDDGDSSDDEDEFQRVFARLKPQANTSLNTTSHAALNDTPSPRSTLLRGVPLPSQTESGLVAAAAALSATGLLLFCLHQQSRLDTGASARLPEAQTLVLQASIYREAQLYSVHVCRVVDSLLAQQEEGILLAAPHSRFPPGAAAVPGGKSPPLWGNAIASEDPKALTRLLYADLRQRVDQQCYAPSSEQQQRQSLHRPPLSHRTLLARIYSSPSPMSSSTVRSTSSPAALQTSQRVHAYPLAHETIAALHHWRQLVSLQQRHLLREEVETYVAAAQLYMAAAAEHLSLGSNDAQQLRHDHDGRSFVEERNHHLQSTAGTSAAPLDVSDAAGPVKQSRNHADVLSDPSMHTAAARWATYGVTNLLRACGLLLSNPPLAQEIVYPASLLYEVAQQVSERKPTNGEDRIAVPPRVSAGPHRVRVWQLLAQLARFLDADAGLRSLPLPWETSRSDARRPSLGTVQMLWELAVAVLLIRPSEELRLGLDVLMYAESACVDSRAPLPCMRDLLAEYAEVVGSTSTTRPGHAVAQEGDHTMKMHSDGWTKRRVPAAGCLPLCLQALRGATSTAVRAGCFAEALRSAEVALTLLELPENMPECAVDIRPLETPSGKKKEKESSATNAAILPAPRAVLDYRRAVSWADTSAPPTCSSSSLMWSAPVPLYLLHEYVYYLVLRTVLLVVSAPLAVGEGVSGMALRQKAVTGLFNGDAADVVPMSAEAGGAEERKEEEEEQDTGMSPADKSGPHPSLTTALQHTLDVIGNLITAMRQCEAAIPLTAWKKNATPPASAAAIASTSAGAGSEKPARCTLSASIGFQQLKAKYRQRRCVAHAKELAAVAVEGGGKTLKETPLSMSEQPTSDAPVGSPSASSHLMEAPPSEREKGEQQHRKPPSFSMTEALKDLHALLSELLALVSVLTRPLRTKSCGVDVPNDVRDTAPSDTAGEGGTDNTALSFDSVYAQARASMRTYDARLASCLEVLGARDAVLFVVLQQLRSKLLFPFACGPFVLEREA